jgi:DNA-binding response OmpR family regulator
MITENIHGKAPIITVTDIRRTAEIPDKLEEALTRDTVSLRRTNNVSDSVRAHLAIIRDDGMENTAFDFLEELRRFSDIPVIMLPQKPAEMYTLMALSKGADVVMDGSELMTFELRARIAALLRRSLDRQLNANSRMISNGAVSVDRLEREVYANGSRVRLTAIEYGILEFLLQNCGTVCSAEDIYRSVWHEQPYSIRKTIVEHIRRIRTKIEPDPHNPVYIRSVSGIGYRMEKAAI